MDVLKMRTNPEYGEVPLYGVETQFEAIWTYLSNDDFKRGRDKTTVAHG